MRVGDLAPDFTLSDQNGVARTLSDYLARGPIVLFFYPAASTAGCTREVCHFRDLAADFAAVGASLLGVSMDDVAHQHDFAESSHVDFPLLSDVDGAAARLYRVKRPLDLLKVRRTTFVIGSDRRIVEVIASELRMNAHADRALAALAAR